MNIVRVFDSNVAKSPDKPFPISDGHEQTPTGKIQKHLIRSAS